MNRQQKSIQWAHPIRAVAFDMDGLLVNTEQLYSIVGDTILARRGKRFTQELKNAMMGLPGAEAFTVMITHEGLDDSVEDLARESDEVFAGILPTQLKLLPGVAELLQTLDSHAIPRCVATSSSHEFAREVLERTDIASWFGFVITAEDVPRGKPYPDIYLAAAERMVVEPRNMLVLEDSLHGTTAGLASGACTVAVPGEHSAHFDFSGAAAVLENLASPDLEELVLGRAS